MSEPGRTGSHHVAFPAATDPTISFINSPNPTPVFPAPALPGAGETVTWGTAIC